ncbi:SRPBCC family protein [uncultured Psychroserpens sp.]|uniref:SRPBCC family protein n=1 Tax=uncultured Psychroserpens sp. TaxID=255436 RepID=UPI0026294158|nr:SRPBCC family protein [uncultured Psychroserpens sp.]
MKNTITISQSLIINASQEAIWNYTQDFDNRPEWDTAVMESEVIQKKPFKLVHLKMKGGLQTDLKYKLCRRPLKTSLVMTNTKSLLFSGGGGSWVYNNEGEVVEWIQTNTLIVKHKFIYWCFGKLIKQMMHKQTKTAMMKAKLIIEQNLST